MPRRGENIYKRKDGRWEGRIRKPAPRTGYKSMYGKTYKEIKEKMDDYKREQPEKGESCTFTMREAAGIWLKEKQFCWKPTTYGTYRQVLDRHIIPHLGNIRISRIDGQVLENFRAGLDSPGKAAASGEKGMKLQGGKKAALSNNYQFYICSLVIRIMAYIRKKYDYSIQLPDNPVTQDKRNRSRLPGDHTLAILEQYLMENIQDKTCLGISVVLYTGLRIGELCALKWEDVDFDENVIHIRRNAQRIRTFDGQKNKTEVRMITPKTADSLRTIPIPSVLRPLLEKCKGEKKGFLIPGNQNAWIDTRTLQYRFKRILQKCGIVYFNFHQLRHAFATRCVSIGFDIKSLSEILGHSNIQITMALYIHPTMKQKKQLMDRFVPYVGMEYQYAG